MAGKDPRNNKRQEVGHVYYPDLLADLDGRFREAKYIRGQLQVLMNDLGGLDALSFQQRSLCRRAIYLEYIIASWEKEISGGGADSIDTGKYTQSLNSLLGLYRALGMARRPKDVVSLQTYLVQKEGKQ